MSAKAPVLKTKKNGAEKSPAKLHKAGVKRKGRRATTAEADPVDDNGRNGNAATVDVVSVDHPPQVDAFVTLVQELLRNALPKFDPVAMIEFRTVLEREITAALEAKGVCECHPAVAAAIRERRARTEALKECLNDITQVSELNDIKQAANSRIRLLTKGKTYRRKVIKGREYLYEVYWDSRDKKKKYRYVGPVGSEEAGKNGDGKHD